MSVLLCVPRPREAFKSTTEALCGWRVRRREGYWSVKTAGPDRLRWLREFHGGRGGGVGVAVRFSAERRKTEERGRTWWRRHK